MNNRKGKKYCCYRHFKQGKHDISCTVCNDHVQLGVINPPHQHLSPTLIDKPQNLMIRAKPFRIENRTHDYNEVQNKDSLPTRLQKPRVYVEQIMNKNVHVKPLLPTKISGNNQYEQTVFLFRKIGQNLSHKTKHNLVSLIMAYCSTSKTQFSSISQVFLTKSQFLEFLINNFKNFSYEDAELFWRISFNQLRFHDKISMQAFVFNFDKFYLRQQNFNNMFSQTALRQRLVDLRVILYDWATQQFAMKYNMRCLSDEINNILQQLKLSQSQQIYHDFHKSVQNCKIVHIRMRALAQVLFTLTDSKNLTAQKLKQSIVSTLDDKYTRLVNCRKILKQFFDTVEYTNGQKFAITDIVQFCKTQNKNQQQISYMINWIQGMFDYVYYMHPGISQSAGLKFNLETRRLQCEQILQIDANLIKQYDRYLQYGYENSTQICKQLNSIIDSALQKMPVLQGFKKGVVQCNYVTEVILRYARYIEYRDFWWVIAIIKQWRQDHNYLKIKSILQTKPSQQTIKKTMKQLFTLPTKQLAYATQPNELQQSKQSPNSIESILHRNDKLKNQPFILNIKSQASPKNKQSIKQYSQLDKLFGDSKNNNQQVSQQCRCQLLQNQSSWQRQFGLGAACPHYSKYNLNVSRQTNETISAVQSLQSRLFQLLQLDIGHKY